MAVTDAAREPDALRNGPIIESVVVRPAEDLRHFIAHYSGYRQAGVAPATHAGLPSPYLTVIFTLDEPLTIAAHPDPAQPGGDYVTLAGGLHAAPALIRHNGRQSGIQLAVSPLGARVLRHPGWRAREHRRRSDRGVRFARWRDPGAHPGRDKLGGQIRRARRGNVAPSSRQYR
jgi:hypothetical protein